MVSIIIPTFNRETLIQETLNSIIGQTYQNWEALVVDDNSTDKTCDIIRNFSKKDSRIKFIKRNRDPKGAPVCRNIGIKNAKGEYVIFLDSDDLLTPFCLQKRVLYMEQNPLLDFAVFQMGILTTDGTFRNDKLTQMRNNYLYAFLRHDLPWQTTSPIWHTDFIKINMLEYNEKYPRLQDPEFHTRVLLIDDVKFKVDIDSNPDYFYRFHSNKVFNATILLKGFELYIFEFYERIKNRTDFLDCRNQLKFCFIEALKGFYSYNANKYTKENIVQLISITSFAFKEEIISHKIYLYSKLLIQFYRIRIYKIPYGKYILRFVMKLIKNS